MPANRAKWPAIESGLSQVKDCARTQWLYSLYDSRGNKRLSKGGATIKDLNATMGVFEYFPAPIGSSPVGSREAALAVIEAPIRAVRTHRVEALQASRLMRSGPDVKSLPTSAL